jgi:tetratricopeptide (TPR) repeat protein
MRRDTVVFGLAGVVFGFVAGYMSAGWSRPAAAIAEAPATTPAAPAASLDPNEARALEALAGRDPNDVVVRVELGNLYMDHQRWDEAIKWYREALVLDPGLTNILNELGACLVQSGRFAEGLAAFDEALAQDATDRNALYNRGLALEKLGRTSEAAAVWEEVLRLYPDDPVLRGLPAEIDRLRSSEGAPR